MSKLKDPFQNYIFIAEQNFLQGIWDYLQVKLGTSNLLHSLLGHNLQLGRHHLEQPVIINRSAQGGLTQKKV